MARVLVIEDDAQFRELVTLALQLERHTVQQIGSGEAAVRMLSAPAEPLLDLITLDLSMPGVSGWDVLDAIVANPALDGVPLLVLTALADDRVRRRAHHPRIFAMLVKPLSVDEIIAAVNAALGNA